MSEKILIIDDDLDTLRLVGLMLQRQGYQISAATNGQQGLDKAFDEDPDLILLDIMMPDMDGYEVTTSGEMNETDGPSAQARVLRILRLGGRRKGHGPRPGGRGP